MRKMKNSTVKLEMVMDGEEKRMKPNRTKARREGRLGRRKKGSDENILDMPNPIVHFATSFSSRVFCPSFCWREEKG